MTKDKNKKDYVMRDGRKMGIGEVRRSFGPSVLLSTEEHLFKAAFG